MTVKAMGQISLLDMNDVIASSTAPSNPKDGALWWNTTNSTLYVCQSGKWIVSTATYVASRGQNLVTNGTGLMGDNTNFSQFEFDGSDFATGSFGSFKDSGTNDSKFSDEIMPVDVNQTYRLTVWAKTNPDVNDQFYIGLVQYDSDGNSISPDYHMYVTGTLTTLAQDLKKGDTVVYLTSTANWNNNEGSATYRRKFIFWNYVNDTGYAWPAETYSRNTSPNDLWADGSINTTSNTITLRAGWTGNTIPKGTQLSQGNSGSTYTYTSASNVTIPNVWTEYTGTIGGLNNSGNDTQTQFNWGCAGVKIMMLNNRNTSGSTVWYSNISFTIDLASAVTVTTIQTTLGNMANDNLLDYQERQYIKDKITDIIGYVQPDTTTTLPTTSTLDGGSKGSFYKSRKSALDAGLTTSDTNYVNLATQYNALKTYLEGLTPIDCWDVSTTNQNSNVTVVKSTWRTNWSNYYNAEQQLDTATSAKLKSNVDNLQVGGTNLIDNSALTSVDSSTGILTDWQPLSPTDAWSVDSNNPFQGYSTLMYQWVTGDTTTYPMASSNDIDVVSLGLIGKQVTLSAWAKIPSGVTMSGSPYIEIATYSDSSISAQGSSNPQVGQVLLPTVGDGLWHKYTLTVTVPATNPYGNVLTIRANLRTNEGSGKTTDQMWYALPKLEAGQIGTDWSPNPNDIIPQINNIVNNAMLNIDTDSITATVLGSDAMDTKLAPYVDTDYLTNNYPTNKQMSDADTATLTSAQKYADKYKIDPSDFIASTDSVQTVNDITDYITKSGGVNLIKNSVGFAGVNVPVWNWYTSDHTIINTTTDGLDAMGFGSGFMFTANTSNKGIYQDVPVTPGEPYTMSWYLNKTTGVSGDASYRFYVQIQEDANGDGTIETVYDLPDNSGTITNGYQYYSTTYTPVTSTIRVRFIAYSNCTAIVTGIMLNAGSLALQWQLSAGEIYNTIVKMDLNGITVAHLDSTGVETSRTIMTPDKFAGYYDVNQDGYIDESDDSVDEVFRIDATNFIMQNAVVKSSITMDTIKVIPVNGSGHVGWAWVASAD